MDKHISLPIFTIEGTLTLKFTILWWYLVVVLVVLEGEFKVAEAAVVPLNTVPLHRVVESLRPRGCGE